MPVLFLLPSSLMVVLFLINRQWTAVSYKGRGCYQAQCWHKGENYYCAKPVVCECHASSALLFPIYFKSRKYSVFCYCTGCVSTAFIVQVYFFYPIQERSRAGKYQVSPDMQHVLLAFEVKPVRKCRSAISCCIFFQKLPSFDCDAVCLCRSINIPMWPSTLFSALWHSKTHLCGVFFLLPVVFFCLFCPSQRSLTGRYSLSLTSCNQYTVVSPIYLLSLCGNAFKSHFVMCAAFSMACF